MHFMKKIVPAAIALAFAGAAQAQVSIYGLVDMSVGKNEYVDGPTAKTDIHSGGDDGQSQGNSTTRIGVKGSFDVAKDVKANFKFETNGITADGAVNGTNSANSPTFFNRQAWLGFSHTTMGEIRVGRQDSVPFQVMGQFDFNGQSNGVTTAFSGVAVWATDRQSRSVQYISPAMSGFKVHAGVVPEGDNTTASGTDDNTSAVVSAAVTYSMGELLVGGTFESARETLANPTAEDFKSVAASYDFKVVKVMAGYTDGPGLYTGAARAKGPTIGVVAPVGSFSVGLHAAKDTTNKVEAIEVFANTELFKNTYGYVEAGRTDNNLPNGTANSYAAGVIFVF